MPESHFGQSAIAGLVAHLEGFLGDPFTSEGPFGYAAIVEHEERGELPPGTAEAIHEWVLTEHRSANFPSSASCIRAGHDRHARRAGILRPHVLPARQEARARGCRMNTLSLRRNPLRLVLSRAPWNARDYRQGPAPSAR